MILQKRKLRNIDRLSVKLIFKAPLKLRHYGAIVKLICYFFWTVEALEDFFRPDSLIPRYANPQYMACTTDSDGAESADLIR